MSLRTKQALILLLATVLPFAMGGIAVAFIVAPAYRRAVARSYEEESRRLAEHIGWNVAMDINRLEKLAAWTEVRNLAQRSHVSDARAAEMDRRWPTFTFGSNELRPILYNTVAKELRWWKDTEANATLIFATDAKGRVIASTGKTEDYVDNDDAWWQATFANGAGRTYVSDVVRDPKSHATRLEVAVPIFADGRSGSHVTGALKMVLDVPETVRDLRRAGMEGADTFLIDHAGHIVLSISGSAPPDGQLPPRVLGFFGKRPDGSSIVKSDDDSWLYAWAQIPIGPHGEPREMPGQGLAIVTRRPTADALGTVRSVQIWMLFISLVTIAIAVGLGYWLVDLLVVRQIRLLATGMRQLARGDFQMAAESAEELTHHERKSPPKQSPAAPV